MAAVAVPDACLGEALREDVRAFVRLRDLIGHNREMAKRLDDLESRYGRQFKAVFDAIRELMAPPAPAPKRRIGFVQGECAALPVASLAAAGHKSKTASSSRYAGRLTRNHAA